MALIKLGGLAQDVRGSLNGTVFSRNRGGAYVRSKVSPVQPITDKNGVSRSIFGSISQRWSSELTDAQRAGWVAFAATHTFVNVFGDSIVLSGIAFYQAVNRRVLQVGGDVIDDAPLDWSVADSGINECTVSAASGLISNVVFGGGRPLDYNEGYYVFGTAPLLGARSVQKNDLRLLNTSLSGLFLLASDISTAYNQCFIPLTFTAGQRVAVRVAILNELTGAMCSPILFNCLLDD